MGYRGYGAHGHMGNRDIGGMAYRGMGHMGNGTYGQCRYRGLWASLPM